MPQGIPSNITSEHVRQAIDEIVLAEIPARRGSTKYDLVIDEHRLPPKYVLSIANKYANGIELDSTAFNAVQAKDFLEKKGFTIEKYKAKNQQQKAVHNKEADSFYTALLQFLQQADTVDLKTKAYPKHFAGLQVKVSFGSGNKAQVPWIAFLKKEDKVQDGIYPVYLYYATHQLLILAYGVSETNIPNRTWELDNPQSIASYFKAHHLGDPPRYGHSYVYKVYDVSATLHKDAIDEDLLNIINRYKQTDAALMPSTTINNKDIQIAAPFSLSDFTTALEASGLTFEPQLATRLVASLLTKPFVILTGLSGSGKTKLAQSFAQWLCNNTQQYCIVPVGADWTNREPLLGYPNALNSKEYIRPDNGALDLIIRANNNPSLPYFLMLDEMNLSHVECYFADFLSVMESKEGIPLYAEQEQEKSGVPPLLNWPANLFVIGTVNIDETTNMFSPKVLDRANTIEFKVSYEEMRQFLDKARSIDMNQLNAKGATMANSFLQLALVKQLPQKAAHIHETLLQFFKELRKLGAEFGYRSATEMLHLLYQLGTINSALTLNEQLDIAIMQKLLPKLHGSRRKLCPVLIALGKLCVENSKNVDITSPIEKDIFEVEDYNYNQQHVLYPLSLEKIVRMYKGAIDNGFASFAEA